MALSPLVRARLQIWDIDTLELLDTLKGHDNPVCTLATANGLLFSGSLKIVKVLCGDLEDPV